MIDSRGTFGLWGGTFYSFGVASRSLCGRGVFTLVADSIFVSLSLMVSFLYGVTLTLSTELPSCYIWSRSSHVSGGFNMSHLVDVFGRLQYWGVDNLTVGVA